MGCWFEIGEKMNNDELNRIKEKVNYGSNLDMVDLIKEIERLRTCIWPGLESWPWKPTEKEPKQDFYEAICESYHRTNKVVLEMLSRLEVKEVEKEK